MRSSVWESYQNVFYGNQCGSEWREDEAIWIYDNTGDIRTSFTIKLIAQTFDEDTKNESFCLQEVNILLYTCNPLCSACSASSRCNGCIANAIMTNGVCGCSEGYFREDSVTCSGCSSCKPCSSECLSCFGPTNTQCFSCRSGKILLFFKIFFYFKNINKVFFSTWK